MDGPSFGHACAGRDFLQYYDVAMFITLQQYYTAFVSVDPELAGVSVVYIRICISDGGCVVGLARQGAAAIRGLA